MKTTDATIPSRIGIPTDSAYARSAPVPGRSNFHQPGTPIFSDTLIPPALLRPRTGALRQNPNPKNL